MNNLQKTAIAAALGFAASTSNATAINNLLSTLTVFEDDSAEELIDRNTNGVLDVGDSLRGIVNFPIITDAFTSVNTLLGTGGNNELSGVFEAEVVAKIDTGDDFSYFDGTTVHTFDIYDFVFGANAAFATEMGLISGSVLAVYEDPNAEFAIGGTTCTTTGSGGDCEANIINGSLWGSAGFYGDADDFWTARAIDQTILVGQLGTTTTSTPFGFDFGLGWEAVTSRDVDKQVFAAIPTGLGQDGLVDIQGSGDLLGTRNAAGTLMTPYHLTDDMQATIYFVPEPASLALMGLGLLGMGAAGRRRKA